MAIYHLRASVVSRSAGRSSTAAAAYRCATRIDDERTGLSFDYAGKSGVEHTEILAPGSAPDWVQDRSRLWNSVEKSETRKNSQVAREIRVALPCELSLEQRIELVRGFCEREFVERGMVADIALHAPGREGDDRNHHAHIMLTTREIGGDGFTTKNRDWNKVEVLEGWRAGWSRDCNDALERAGAEERVDHRTLEAQRDEARERSVEAHERGDESEALAHTVRAVALDRKPLPQLSPGAWQLKERGIEVGAVSLWHEVKAQAVEVKRVAAELAGQVRSWLERASEKAMDRFAPSQIEMAIEAARGAEVGRFSRTEPIGGKGIEESQDFVARLREAWTARGKPEGKSGSSGAGESGLSRRGDDVEDDGPRDLAAELREAAKEIDRDSALQRAVEFQQGRKYEENRRELAQRQAVEEKRAVEEQKQRDAEGEKERDTRGRGRGLSR